MNARIAEHRWGDRVSVDIPVQLIGPDRTVVSGRLTSFSVCGALVEADLDVPVMTNITVMIHYGGRVPMRPRAMAGYVVRHVEGGIALGWWKLAPITTTHMALIQKTLLPMAPPLQFSKVSFRRGPACV